MTLLVVAVFLGLGGGGAPLTSTIRRTPVGTLQGHSIRIERARAPTQLDLSLATRSGDNIAVWIGNEFLSGVERAAIIPQPGERTS